jgi:FkbM family methyltransferase
MSKSQFAQDLNVVKFYNKKQNGYFIEIGASDGIGFSNTYLLETEYNWKGICVEPSPKQYAELVKNRPNSSCCDNPVFSTSGQIVQFDIANSCNHLSGISEYIDCYKNLVELDKTTIQLTTISLNDLLKKYNAPTFIEYLSLDTEGSEYEILKSTDFNTYIFGIIHVEHNYQEPRRTQIRKLLLANGYIYLGENIVDDSYRHSSL